MKKYDILSKIKGNAIAIVRGDNADDVVNCCFALYEAGIKVMELPLTTPYVLDALKTVSMKLTDAVVGAGSVLDSESARIAILYGAKFIVTPSLDEGAVKVCHRYGIPVIPGVATPTEAEKALSMGVDVVKLFPASNFNTSIIKELQAPFPNLEIVPTGGVNAENFATWLNAGAFACGVGGAITNGIKTKDWELVKLSAKKFL